MRLFVLLALTVPTLALAVPAESAPQVRYKDVTEIDMGDVDVNSGLRKPHGTYLIEKRKSTFNPLVQLKEHFQPEMLESVNQVR